MPKYLVSFNDGDMQFDESELEQVGADAHAVMQDAIDKGVWVFGGGFEDYTPWTVDKNGSVKAGPIATSSVVLGGFCVLDVASDDEASAWAQRFALACRCNQEVRRFMDDPVQEEAMGKHRHS